MAQGGVERNTFKAWINECNLLPVSVNVRLFKVHTDEQVFKVLTPCQKYCSLLSLLFVKIWPCVVQRVGLYACIMWKWYVYKSIHLTVLWMNKLNTQWDVCKIWNLSLAIHVWACVMIQLWTLILSNKLYVNVWWWQ